MANVFDCQSNKTQNLLKKASPVRDDAKNMSVKQKKSLCESLGEIIVDSYEKSCCGGRIRTCDLKRMRLAS